MSGITDFMLVSTLGIIASIGIVGWSIRGLLFDIRDELKKMNEREK